MMQRYRSHKIVEAGKITGINGFTEMVEVGGQQYPISPTMTARYVPKIGDYLVRYADGYLSFSPAKAFEDGYTLVDPQDADTAKVQDSGDITLPIEPAKLGIKRVP